MCRMHSPWKTDSSSDSGRWWNSSVSISRSFLQAKVTVKLGL